MENGFLETMHGLYSDYHSVADPETRDGIMREINQTRDAHVAAGGSTIGLGSVYDFGRVASEAPKVYAPEVNAPGYPRNNPNR